MRRIGRTFKRLRDRGEAALIGYLTFGDPDIATSKKLLKCLSSNVDILEIGLPFSDPIADGPTIQGAIARALASGVNTDLAFDAVAELRAQGVGKPFVFMSYYNIVLQYGVERFLERCRECGVDGLLVSDLPIEEAGGLVEACTAHEVDLVFLISPITPAERARRIASISTGFLYLVSLLGVTGERRRLQERTLEAVKEALKVAGDLPLAVGFGISRAEHVRSLVEAGADGVVVGSAFVNIVAREGGGACSELERLSAELKEGTR